MKVPIVQGPSQLSQRDVPGLHALFDRLDADHSGGLDADELRVALARQGRAISDRKAPA